MFVLFFSLYKYRDSCKMGRDRRFPIIASIQELFFIHFDSTQPVSLYVSFTTSVTAQEDSVFPCTSLIRTTIPSLLFPPLTSDIGGIMQPRCFSQCAVVQMAVVVYMKYVFKVFC